MNDYIMNESGIHILFVYTPCQNHEEFRQFPLYLILDLISSAVDRGFESRSGQTKKYKIGIC
jgi:hypothetical protein